LVDRTFPSGRSVLVVTVYLPEIVRTAVRENAEQSRIALAFIIGQPLTT
jgi:hypothetical protein